MQRVSQQHHGSLISTTSTLLYPRHIHVSLRRNGVNIFAVSKEELKSGRAVAANNDTRFISREAEMFLAGLLEGLPDGMAVLLSRLT